MELPHRFRTQWHWMLSVARLAWRTGYRPMPILPRGLRACRNRQTEARACIKLVLQLIRKTPGPPIASPMPMQTSAGHSPTGQDPNLHNHPSISGSEIGFKCIPEKCQCQAKKTGFCQASLEMSPCAYSRRSHPRLCGKMGFPACGGSCQSRASSLRAPEGSLDGFRRTQPNLRRREWERSF